MATYDGFSAELKALRNLFGDELVDQRLARLIEIFEYTEDKWQSYVAMLPGRRVKYLLIGEAPPWAEAGPPKYMLDPESNPGTWLRAVCRAFALGKADNESAPLLLRELAERGLLLVDSLPFSMDYSPVRSTRNYDRLVHLTAKTYLERKLATVSPLGLRIAFGVRRNALAVIKACPQLRLGGSQFVLSESMVATSRANYPSPKELRAVYGLELGP